MTRIEIDIEKNGDTKMDIKISAFHRDDSPPDKNEIKFRDSFKQLIISALEEIKNEVEHPAEASK